MKEEYNQPSYVEEGPLHPAYNHETAFARLHFNQLSRMV
jgi:hypothetical protein